MDERHQRPPGTADATVEAVGKVSEALEWVERARGHLYEFHQQLGRADLLFGEAAAQLRDAGHLAEADALDTDVVGRNVLDGRWTFQVVEEFEALYWAPVRSGEQDVVDRLMGGRRHVFEAEMKERRQTHEAGAVRLDDG